ncbi:MAG: BON domain-containing protein [Spirochaetales bacterium]|nr:BON domain-containing protein [Spirochaetales bacterium]
MSRTKEKIKKDIVDHLYWDSRVDSSDIKVVVDDNDVVLEGNVTSFSALTAVEEDAKEVAGLKHVRNYITVKFPDSITLPSDSEMETIITNMLRWNSDIDAGKIKVSVTGGKATLEGNVNSYWKKIKAARLAGSVFGVIDVDNKISIVPNEDAIDEMVANNIVQAFTRNSLIDPATIDVKVADGIVTLTGTVPHLSAYEKAESIVYFTQGVLFLHNNLAIV